MRVGRAGSTVYRRVRADSTSRDTRRKIPTWRIIEYSAGARERRPFSPSARPHCPTEDTMSNTLRRVDYFYVMVPNRAGQGAKIMAGLAAEGVTCSPSPDSRAGRKARWISCPRTARNSAKRRKTRPQGLRPEDRLPVSRRRSRRRDDEGLGGSPARRSTSSPSTPSPAAGALRRDFLGEADGGRESREGARSEVAAVYA